MTRINLVDPEELHDQHLMAEYREIFMVGSALQRSLRSKNWNINNIPTEFTLNKNHVKFFYNKGLYLHKRYMALCEELRKRNYDIDSKRVFKVEQWPPKLYKDWTPSERDKNIVRERIAQRIALKPDWYRKTQPK